MEVFVFTLFAIIAVVSAINVVIQTHPISSALSLVGVMVSLAVMYLLLGAEFIAMAQIIVYAGAVMVLFVFVIMLLNTEGEHGRGHSLMVPLSGIPALIVFLGTLGYYLMRLFPNSERVVFGGFTLGNAHEFGKMLFTDYLLPFEVTSVLILIAIIGAIVLARKEMD